MGWPFINGHPTLQCHRLGGRLYTASLHPACACSPDTVKHRSSDGTSVRGPLYEVPIM
ncbi:unnamed protein product [Staurois parvus]|uniref:Uncharacterized protein n=1 Tax=Staurois parvus TaxID=386267 RepID=A0ABN9DLC7_9NEOB|nr:unnamed protein product [Staurois parvus]